jgi:preprotein translocase subunit SecG
MLYTVVIVLTLIAAVLLVGVVLIQKSKGGGLGSSFAGSNQILGVRRTNDVVEKATWYLAAAVCVLSIVSVFCAPEITHTTGIRSHTETSAPAAEGFDQQQQSTSTEAPAAAQEAPAAEAPTAE